MSRGMCKEIFSIGGPCAAGKDTIAKELIGKHNGKIVRFPRTTTRKPRPVERDGIEYYFISQEEFIQRSENCAIVGVDHAGIASYGIDIEKFQETLENGSPEKVLIVGGISGIALRKFFPNILNIYIIAEIDELVRRLHSRGHRDEDFYRRVNWIHKQIIQEPFLFDVIVRNPQDRLADTMKIIERIIGI